MDCNAILAIDTNDRIDIYRAFKTLKSVSDKGGLVIGTPACWTLSIKNAEPLMTELFESERSIARESIALSGMNL